eukprot:2017037-Amphidinium_carterae.1
MSRWRPSEKHGSLGGSPRPLPFTTCSRIQLGPHPFPDVARAGGLSTYAEGDARTNAMANAVARTNSHSLVSHQARTNADARTNSHSERAGGLAEEEARPLFPGLGDRRAPINVDARTNLHSEGHQQVSTPHACGLHHVWLSHGPDILGNVVTWNAAGLLHHDECTFVIRARVLEQLKDASILCLQEVHGGGVAEALFDDDWYTFSSMHPVNPRAAGGVILAIRRSRFPHCALVCHTLLEGRILACKVYLQDCVLLILGVHIVDDKTVGISWTHSVSLVSNYLHAWSTEPVMLLGDVNFQTDHDEVLEAGPSSAPTSLGKRTFWRADFWNRHIQMSLVAGPWSLHHKASRSLRSCDKVFVNASLAILSALNLTVRTVGSSSSPPGGSDHFP